MHIDKEFDETLEKYFMQKQNIKIKFVNQIDSATSGVMILGKTRKGTGIANRQFFYRQVQKYYVVELEQSININNIKQTTFQYENKEYKNIQLQNDGGICVSSFIDDDKDDIKQFKMKYSYQEGRFSQTIFYPINIDNYHNNLFLVKLLTGRRHQIRIHSLILGTWIKNDITYSQQDLPDDAILHLHSIFTVVPCVNDGQPLIANCKWINSSVQNYIIQKILQFQKEL